jgi:hypothetical protein
MIKRFLITNALIVINLIVITAQETTVKREVTLYNPYKPALNEFRKKSFLPEMNDTAKFRPEFRYDVNAAPYMPSYTVSPLRAAVLQPDPLSKLYKSYINLGLGNYTSPLAEVSITNERSKKGAIGFYGRHFSSNGKMKLDNGNKVFSGYMDNDLSLFGKRFLKGIVLGGSVGLIQKTRYAYGYDPVITDYFPEKNDIRVSYANLGADISLSSLNLDSAGFSYDFDVHYNRFAKASDFSQNNFGFSGLMSKTYREFYAGSALGFEHYSMPGTLSGFSQYLASISPFISKNNSQWNFKLGLQALLERNIDQTAKLHLYPDISFGFSLVPSYINFFSSLSGKMERNDPLKIIDENPYLSSGGSLFTLPNTDYTLSVTAGFKGNSGVNGSYILSASYSLVNNMLFYSNIVSRDTLLPPTRGNYFAPLTDDVDIINLHAELNQKINDRVAFNGTVNFYHYTTTMFENPVNKPEWDAATGLKYNLRNKILAGLQINALGKRYFVVNGANINSVALEDKPVYFNTPYHINLNLSAEYRYSKILSFWTKLNNISYQKYYDWAYYPTHRFFFMAGFTYCL